MVLPLLVLVDFGYLVEHLVEVLLVLHFFLLVDDFLQRIEVVVLEDVQFEIFEILVAEGTAMMAPHCLLDAVPTVDMSAPGDVAVGDGIEADGALELVLQLLGADPEVVVVEVVFDLHLILCQYNRSNYIAYP